MNLLACIEYPCIYHADLPDFDIFEFAPAGRPLPLGQYAVVRAQKETVCLVRDPLGCNKLFFGLDGGGRLVAANRVSRLWQGGVPLGAIQSCPPGHMLEISGAGVRDVGGADASQVRADAEPIVSAFTAQSRAILQQVFARLTGQFEGSRFVVCLSGGLDSSVVASFADAHLANVTAASFTYLDETDLRRHAEGVPASELASVSVDFRCAAAVARALEMPLLPVVRSRHAVAAAMRQSVHLCQDWRDFNVHCATVNLFLAQDIRAAFPGERVVVLTGDLMNEFVCDYAEERVGNSVYYKLPRIPADKRRKYLVRGLDAGDREIGVFSAFGLAACQPFAALAEHFMRIPASMLDQADLKWTLNGELLAPQVAPHVNVAKVRAQVGGEDLGTLGIYHDLGIGEERLRQVWRDQFPGETVAACDDLIQFGRYKAPAYPAGIRVA